MKSRATLVFIIFCAFITPLHAQSDTTHLQTITLTDGSVLVGRILETKDSLVVFESSSGFRAELRRSIIREIRASGDRGSASPLQRVDPNRTRLFFTATGRSLERGNGYFSVYEIFFPMIAVGISDFFTFAGGMTLFPGADQQMLYFAPKLRLFHQPGVDASAGILYISVESLSLGITYGVVTVGSDRAALTGGLGWGFAEGDLSSTPVLVLGGELQVSNSVKLLTENWVFPKAGGALISFGVRFFGDNLAGDFGLMRATESSGGGFPFVPWIGFAYNF